MNHTALSFRIFKYLPLLLGLGVWPAATSGQAPSASSQDSNLPFTVQLRKVVVLIETDCLHEPTPEELSQLTPEDQAKWKPEEVAKLTNEQMARMKQDKWFGTGFIVRILDTRLVSRFGDKAGYNYLVTNRHVAQPGIERGHPCRVIQQFIGANLRDKSGAGAEHLQMNPSSKNDWTFPTDESVDLAATNFMGTYDDWDFMVFNDSMFVTQEELNSAKVYEGNSVLFAGLFIQYLGGKKLEPIIRSGKIAMLPADPIKTTLGAPGHVILAELHSFGGNSGSPVFAEVPIDKNSLAFKYEFLGVVSGEVFETSDFALEAATTYKGDLQANSDVTMLVPAAEVKSLLSRPEFIKQRDSATKEYMKTK